jgi:excisionase family DNA binding protein
MGKKFAGRAAASPTDAAAIDRGAPLRLAYRIDEAMALLGVSRSTVERAIADGRLKSSKKLGVRLIEAQSLRALFDESAQPKG